MAGEAISAGVTGYVQKKRATEQYTILANRITNAVEKYRTEQELARTNRRYRKLVEQNFVGIYIIQDGEFIYVNPKLAEIHGYDREELIGMSPLEIVAPEERDRVKNNLQRRLDGEVEDIKYETVGLTKSGDRIDIGLHGSRINHKGEPAVIGAELDITTRKQQQRQLGEKNERLEEFASVVTHDLRNPLTILKSSLDSAQQSGEQKHFERAQRAVTRMSRLIDDLRTLTQTGDKITDRESVPLNEFVWNCWQSVETKEATLVTETTQTIDADPDRLRQLFENLFRNAVEHGGTSVTVTVNELDEQCGFAVADDGTGIPPEKHEDIFDRSYSTDGSGTGLGLHIVEQIANAHNWQVSATDSQKGGAQFEITGVESAE